MPVVETVAVRKRGMDEVMQRSNELLLQPGRSAPARVRTRPADAATPGAEIAMGAIIRETPVRRITHRLDGVLLHPVAGPIILAAVMFPDVPRRCSPGPVPRRCARRGDAGRRQVGNALPASWFSSMIVDGVFAGVGAVIVFLPQILILFGFILVVESTGYMVRAAFIMDRLMSHAGLSGRAFIPLLSSFACAVPGIMATRTIDDPKDRLTTILVAPLMTCSARLPVYTLIIAAFIPAVTVGPGIGLQGLILFGLYFRDRQCAARRDRAQQDGGEGAAGPMPEIADVEVILRPPLQAVPEDVLAAQAIILGTTILLWALASFPQAKPGESQVEVSIAGHIGRAIHVVVAPIGFNQDISLALLPTMAAREVAVSAIGTVYALDATDDQALTSLEDRLASRWSLATALAFLAWFIFAPQCISTIAVTRRETNGWKWPMFMVSYPFVLVRAAAGATYWTAVAFGLG